MTDLYSHKIAPCIDYSQDSMSDIKITLPDGSSRTLPEGSTGHDLAADIGAGLAKAALVVKKDEELHDLSAPLEDGDVVAIVTQETEEGLEVLRHSTAHVLAQAVLDLWPDATYAIGPPIENGFYYDFYLPDNASFNPEDLEVIEKKMREIVKADQKFHRHEITTDEALKLFSNHEYKKEIIEKVSSGGSDQELSSEVNSDGTVSYYQNDEGFIDLCLGPHVPSTGRLGHFALQKVAGAYWRGDTNRLSLIHI